MKVRSTILVLALATATALAQNAKPATQAKVPAAPATKPAATIVPAQKPAPVAAQTKAAPISSAKSAPVAVPAKAASVPAKKSAAVTKGAKTPAAQPTKAARAKPELAKAPAVGGKRDPFINPVVNRIGGPSACASGKKCLLVDQVRLQGIVRSSKGMIAMVINAANKTYFLYENDPVFNGYVSKITPDSIVFKETTPDRQGRPQTREVVKKVNTPAV